MLKFRHLILCWMLGSLLLTQWAVAAYACPVQASISQTVTMQMDDCDGMDHTQPALCHALTDSPFDQSLPDQVAHPDLPPFLVLGWVQIVQPVQTSSLFTSFARDNASLARLLAPPLRVQHCSFLH